MTFRTLAFFFPLLLASPVFAAAIDFGPKSDVDYQSMPKVLLETKDSYIYRLPDATEADFADLYWVNLEDSLYDRFTLETVGRVELMSEGHFAVLKIPADRIEAVAKLLHDERSSCGQLHRLFGDEVPGNRSIPAAVPIIPVTESIAGLAALQAQADPAKIRATVESMIALPTRYAKNAAAGKTTALLTATYNTWKRSDVTVKTFAHQSTPMQASVIVRIEGTKHPDEVVIIGSHIDSISTPSTFAPGADDNAAGTASNMEVFRIIMENDLHFDRSIEIHGYASEELGLIGSQDIAKSYANNGTQVIAMLQNDMNMYRENAKDTIWLITNDTDPALTSDVSTLVSRYQSVELHSGRLDAGTSDHRAWTRQGFATVFPTENPTKYNHNLHTPRDTIANSGVFTQSAEFSKLSLAFVAHFAGLERK
ncbi:MAG: M28 family peptidase [Chitinophagaceae bacterium]|nr:M28 family peptidase [Oligoflexus sp.]